MAWAWREQIALTEIFFSASGHCQRGENPVFRYNNGYKQRLGPLVPKQAQFSDLFSWARALKLAEKEKNNGKGNSPSASRFASLSESPMQQILTERHSGKSKQITNWSVSTFKGKLKFFRFKILIVKYQPRAFNRKIEIKLILILPASYFAYREQSLLILLSFFHVWFSGFYVQFHRLCYKTIGSCF